MIDHTQAMIRLPGAPLEQTVGFFEDLGFRADMVFPADNPRITRMSGHGVNLQLDAQYDGDPGVLLLSGNHDESLTAPNGTTVRYVDQSRDLPAFAPSRTISRCADGSWVTGRAGMHYRDLVPDRQGGRYIASHIRITQPGPVPDRVHFHRIRFQMIYCYRGWARLVYEDQGEPFLLQAGDCVLQPPEIRHRVLESGDGLEVVEIGCPAEHETWMDYEMALPNGRDPQRLFHGQRFLHFQNHDAAGDQEFGLRSATGGIAEARTIAISGQQSLTNDGEFAIGFVLQGRPELHFSDSQSVALQAADAFTLGPAEEITVAADSARILLVCVGH